MNTKTTIFALVSAISINLSFHSAANATPTATKKVPTILSQGFDRLLTVGIGVHGGYFLAGSSLQAGSADRVIYGFHFHLRILRVLGISAGYDLNQNTSVQGAVLLPYPNLSLNAHLYLASIGPVFLNISGGIGLNFTKENGGNVLAAYTLGGEVGVKLHPHFVLVGSFRFLLPSYEQTMRAHQTGSSGTNGTGGTLPVSELPQFLQHLLDFRNVQLTLAVRAFL